MTAVSVIVVNFRQADLAARCASSFRRAFDEERIEGEIVLVDCGSGTEEAAALARVPADVRVLLSDNRGYSGGVNAGLARARGDRLLLSNADVEARPGAVTDLLRALDEPRVGAAAPVCAWDAGDRLLLPPGFDPGFLGELSLLRAPRAGARADRRFAAFAREAVSLWTRGGSARHLSGALLAVRREVFDRVGRFDERFPFEYEETEWERRVRAAGLDLRVVASARVRHRWGASASPDPETERRRAQSRRVFRERFYGRAGRALLERAEGRTRQERPPFPRRDPSEIPARPGGWLALSPNASRIPFIGADLSRPFRIPEEIRRSAPRGDWFWTVFSAADGRPAETFAAELA